MIHHFNNMSICNWDQNFAPVANTPLEHIAAAKRVLGVLIGNYVNSPLHFPFASWKSITIWHHHCLLRKEASVKWGATSWADHLDSFSNPDREIGDSSCRTVPQGLGWVIWILLWSQGAGEGERVRAGGWGEGRGHWVLGREDTGGSPRGWLSLGRQESLRVFKFPWCDLMVKLELGMKSTAFKMLGLSDFSFCILFVNRHPCFDW